MPDLIVDALLDSLKLLPFLFIAYLLIEWIEHAAGEKTQALIDRSGRLGPILGALLGAIPQCGFSAAMANFYAGGIITRGTLIAVFLSTSDEMLPILISEHAPVGLILKLVCVKALAGMLAGLVIDLISSKFGRKRRLQIEQLCESAGCDCRHGVLRSAIRHTVQVFVFILLITFVLNLAVSHIGESRLSGFILNRPIAGELLAGLIGLIPNCASSVIITQLYLGGGMSVGGMLAGLLVNAGVGMLVLFRMNRPMKDNFLMLGILYVCGVVLGALCGLLPIF
ncbi:MAG: arsenic efflux protein [Clostridiales bacterium]|nr:arsenic efflux protein [Clostridiales bacterium]